MRIRSSVLVDLASCLGWLLFLFLPAEPIAYSTATVFGFLVSFLLTFSPQVRLEPMSLLPLWQLARVADQPSVGALPSLAALHSR